jgi:hypothetical protein
MPIQTFEPMTKDFATFDCDAHVTEPARIWERAPEYLTRDEPGQVLARNAVAASPAPCG